MSGINLNMHRFYQQKFERNSAPNRDKDTTPKDKNLFQHFSLQTGSTSSISEPRDPFSEIDADVSVKVLSFSEIGPDISFKVLSFLDYPALPVFFSVSKNAQALREKNKQQLERSIFSQVRIFDRTHWEEYYGATITDQFDPSKIDIRILRAFLKTYYGPNPTIPGPVRIAVKDSCLIPTVVPRSMTILGKSRLHYAHLFKELVQCPLKGDHAARYSALYPGHLCFLQNMAQARKASLVLLLRGVVARNKVWSSESQNPDKRGQVQFLEELNAKTGYACETRPDTLSQNTVLFAHHAVTGERPFGDSNGMEGRRTEGHTLELDPLNRHNPSVLASGNFTKAPSGPAELFVHNSYPHILSNEDCGVGVLRKFEEL